MTYRPEDNCGYFVAPDGTTWVGGTFLYTIVPGIDPIIVVGIPYILDTAVTDASKNTSDRELPVQFTSQTICNETIWNTGKINVFAEAELEAWTESMMPPELLSRFTPLVRQLATNLHEYHGADSTWRYDRHRNEV